MREKKNLRKSFLIYPSYNDAQIARLVKVSEPTAQKYREEYLSKMDVEFIKMTAGRFIMEFGEASDYWKLQIDELETLKVSKKTIYKTGSEGQKYQQEVELEPMEILAISKQQTLLREKILFLAAQGEVREVIKVMRSGKLPALQEVV